MLFRPEEIHLASKESSGDFPRINLWQRDIHVADSCRWIYFQNFLIPHADENRISAIKAARVNSNLRAEKEPAHG